MRSINKARVVALTIGEIKANTLSNVSLVVEKDGERFECVIKDSLMRNLINATRPPTSTTDRTDWAWELVKTTDLSKREIITEANVGRNTVARMRRAMRMHTEGVIEQPPAETWKRETELLKQHGWEA